MTTAIGKRKHLFCAAIALVLFASLVAPLCAQEQVGPGLVYSEIREEEVPWEIRVLRADLSSPYLSLDAAVGRDGILAGLERTSRVTQRLDQPGARVAAAVNTDFWGGHREPLGMTVIDGELVRSPHARDVFAVAQNGKLIIDLFELQCSLSRANGETVEIVGVNRWDNKKGAILFTHWLGANIPSAEGESGRIVDAGDAKLATQSALDCTVGEMLEHQSGGVTLPEGKMVLWFPEGKDPGLEQGEKVKLNVSLSPDYGPLQLAVGGGPGVVKDGALVAHAGNFSTARHPRTAVGFTEDGKELVLLVVDGRRSGWSLGMSLKELGEKMLEMGAWDAMNLDGGGSSTMVLWHEVKNYPSDRSGERTVANSLLVRSSAPQEETVSLEIIPSEVRLLAGSTFEFTLLGKDDFGQPMSLSASDVKWRSAGLHTLLKGSVGRISQDGVLKTVNKEKQGMITARLRKGPGARARVVVERPADLKVEPSKISLSLGREAQFEVTPIAKDGTVLEGKTDSLSFAMQGDCGEVSKKGVFKPLKFGSGNVIVSLAGRKKEIPVNVSESYKVLLEDFEQLSDWELRGNIVDMSKSGLIETREQLKCDDHTGKLFYKLEQGGTSALYMETRKPWQGKAEMAQLWVYGDGSGHMLRAELRDDNENVFLITLASSINWKDEWKHIKVSLKDASAHWGNPTAKMGRLCEWKNIYIAEPKESQKNQGALFFDDLEVFTVPIE